MTISNALNKPFKTPKERKQQVVDWQTIILISVPWAAIVSLLIYFIKNPEKAEKWYSILSRAFSFLSLRIEKNGVSRDIQADINSYVKKIGSQTGNPVLPYRVKVNWVSSTNREAFVKEGKVLIKMDYHTNQAKNFLYATMEWVNKGLIPEARHLLDKSILRAAELVFMNDFFTKKKRYDVRQLFLDKVYEPEVSKGSVLETYCTTFDKLNKTGLFMGVALEEFSLLGRKAGSAVPNSKIKMETVSFMNMLNKLSSRMHGEDVNPTHNGENIKCSIVLIARYEKYLTEGLSPYLGWINRCLSGGLCSFYICGVSDPNIMIVRKIRDAYEESRKLTVASENIYHLDGQRAIVLHLQTKAPTI